MLSPAFIVALSAIAVLLLASVRRIPEGQAYTLRRFGHPSRVLGAGFHFVMPLVDRIGHKISLAGNVIEFRASKVASDSAPCTEGCLYYQVLDAERADAVIDDVEALLRRKTLNIIAQSPAANDSAQRDAHIKNELNSALRERGILVTRVQLRG
jgi:regulator of protease activity HflC (stomatin/prohibitin superfamily)